MAALLRGRELIQCRKNDPSLKLTMKRHTKMMAHHKWDKDCSRRLHVFRDVTRHGDRYGWNTSPFNSALHERDRLMSYWSGETQEGSICAIGYDSISNVFG